MPITSHFIVSGFGSDSLRDNKKIGKTTETNNAYAFMRVKTDHGWQGR